MSFQNTTHVSLLFIVVINPYFLFKFKIYKLFCLLVILHFVVGMIMHDYNTVEPYYLW